MGFFGLVFGGFSAKYFRGLILPSKGQGILGPKKKIHPSPLGEPDGRSYAVFLIPPRFGDPEMAGIWGLGSPLLFSFFFHRGTSAGSGHSPNQLCVQSNVSSPVIVLLVVFLCHAPTFGWHCTKKKPALSSRRKHVMERKAEWACGQSWPKYLYEQTKARGTPKCSVCPSNANPS